MTVMPILVFVYVDVALPVPLDRMFTCSVNGARRSEIPPSIT